MINSFFIQKYISKNQTIEDYSQGWQSSIHVLEEVKREIPLNYRKLLRFAKPKKNKRIA